MSDLDDLASAASESPRRAIVRPQRVEYVPSTRMAGTKSHSPFMWGFGVAMGVIAAIAAITIAIVFYGKAREQEIEQEAKAAAERVQAQQQDSASDEAEAKNLRLRAVSSIISVRFGKGPSNVDEIIVHNPSSFLVTDLQGDLGGVPVSIGTVKPQSDASAAVSPALVGLPFHLDDGSVR